MAKLRGTVFLGVLTVLAVVAPYHRVRAENALPRQHDGVRRESGAGHGQAHSDRPEPATGLAGRHDGEVYGGGIRGGARGREVCAGLSSHEAVSRNNQAAGPATPPNKGMKLTKPSILELRSLSPVLGRPMTPQRSVRANRV
jgi:hypothetical protein